MLEKWPQRTFKFDLPAARLPCLLERLRGTPARVEDKIRGVSPERLRKRVGETWSVQENIGHLTDIEELHLARLDELERGVETLRAADMANKKTWEADHNARPIARVLEALRASRAQLVDRLESWDPARLEVGAMHPRLRIPMRVIDVAFFTAEHDDYHLARMQELLIMGQGEFCRPSA